MQLIFTILFIASSVAMMLCAVRLGRILRLLEAREKRDETQAWREREAQAWRELDVKEDSPKTQQGDSQGINCVASCDIIRKSNSSTAC